VDISFAGKDKLKISTQISSDNGFRYSAHNRKIEKNIINF